MIDFLIRFGKVKVRSTPGTRYLYSEKHPQRGYPLNPYNYKDLNFRRTTESTTSTTADV